MPSRGTGTEGIAAQGATGMGAGYQETERTGYERREREEEYEREGVRGTTGIATAEVPVGVVQQTTTTPVTASAGEGYNVTREGREEVCGREYFTKVGARCRTVPLLPRDA